MDGATGHLALSDIVVSFNGFRAVDGLSLEVAPGELRCLIGPNGAGKTTALDLICGKVKPASGQIRLGDDRLDKLDEHEIARKGVGRKFQVPSVFRDLMVRENLEVALSRRSGVLHNLVRLDRSADVEGLAKIAELVGLADQLEARAGHLSHGQAQWLEIAMVLAQDPKIILMDEPTAGMTTQETTKTARLLDRLKRRHTLLVVEHDMAFIKEIAEVISVMDQGRLLAEGTVAEIERDPRVIEAYLGSGGISGA